MGFIELQDGVFDAKGRTTFERIGDLNILRPTKIGIGITTFNRPECLQKCIEQIKKHSKPYEGVLLYVATDTDEDRKGVAFRKNECLRALKDCDHIFLFDDDCWPIKDGWVEYFINSEFNHLLYLNKNHCKMFSDGKIGVYQECGGVFIYLTKKALEAVGGMCEAYNTWGFEHAGYSQRISKAGLIPFPYICLENTSDYIYSMDYSDPNHKSSITAQEKYDFVKQNKGIMLQDIKTIYQPL